MNRISRTIVLCGLVAAMSVGVAACSSSKHAGSGAGGSSGTGDSLAGGASGNSTSSNGATGSTSAVGSGAGNGSGTGTSRTTVPIPTTTAPSTPNWLKAHRSDLKALKAATQVVNAAFQANDDTAKSAALIECANAALPLARSAKGSLPADQADAIVTISDGCASMAHDLRAGDTAAVATTKVAFDKALVVVTPLFP